MTPHDDYLWTGRGQDPEIERLERLLAPYSCEVAAVVANLRQRRPSPVRRRPRAWVAALAASLLLAVAGWAGLQWRLSWPSGEAWQLQAVHGDVRLDGQLVVAAASLPLEGELRTGADGGVQLAVARIGVARLGAGSRLRLESTGRGGHRLRLLEGSLWSRVWAPPRHFGLHLPGVDALDLGCEFLASSDASGNGFLRVRSGWVQVQAQGQEVLVPEGARVDLVSGKPPGTPYDEGASAEFVAALRSIDALGPAVPPAGEEVTRLLAAARRQDAISLLSLVGRYPALAAGPVFDRLRQDLPTPEPVTREAIAAHPVPALEPWWQALPYPGVKRWWLQWPDMLAGEPGLSVEAMEAER